MKVFVFKKVKLLPTLITAGLGLFLAVQALAVELEVQLPGMDKNVYDPGVYIKNLFIFGLSVVGFLAVGWVVIGGIQYMLAGSISTTEKARKTILNALGGILLLLCSYFLLATIDPSLTNLSPINLKKINGLSQYQVENFDIPSHAGLSFSDSQIKSSGLAKGNYANTINAMSQKYNVPANLVKAIIMAESGGNPNAINATSGARGLMQLMPKYHKLNDHNDPAENIEAGTKYLSELLKLHNNDAQKTIASYNWGQGNLKNKCGNDINCAKLPSETKTYLQRVNQYWRDLEGSA